MASSSCRSLASFSAALTTMVSHRMEAVSARVIGVDRCSSVRPAANMQSLWKAWPSSCARVKTWSSEPSKLLSTRDSFTPGTAMQKAPARLPSRGPASIQLLSKARAAKTARSGEKASKWRSTKSRACA